MKRDWSLSRITVLLYIIVAMLPLNYYFANRSFESMQSDSNTMQRLVVLNGSIQQVARLENTTDVRSAVIEIDSMLDAINTTFIDAPSNTEYVTLFRAKESFDTMKEAWDALKSAVDDPTLSRILSDNCFRKVNDFSKVTEDMLDYKSDNMLDMLYISLVFTMLFIVALIFSIRFYIHIQLQKHAIHDHVTGLYNKKYFREVLQKAKLFSVRHNVPLSIITLSFENYDTLKQRSGKKEFESLLYDFAKILKHSFRQSDTISRIEENCFVVIVEASSVEFLQEIVEKLDQELLNAEIESKEAVYIRQGYAEYNKESTHPVLDEAKEKMAENNPICIGGCHAS